MAAISLSYDEVRRIGQSEPGNRGLTVTAEAILPRKGVEFANEYFELCRNLQQVERQLQNHSLHGVYYENGDSADCQRKRPKKTEIKLKDPFAQFDSWIEGVWREATILLTNALEEANLSKGRPVKLNKASVEDRLR
jgi:hypothetical protein